MKSRFATPVLLLLALFAPAAFVSAAPAENHWDTGLDDASQAAFDKAKGLIDAENYAAALPTLQALARSEPGDADVANLLGFAYRKTGNLDASADAYERALYLKPDHRGALEYQGELFLTLGDASAAEANLARLQKICPSPCEETDDLAAAIKEWRDAQTQ